jgi:ribosomal small subunit protein bTHX
LASRNVFIKFVDQSLNNQKSHNMGKGDKKSRRGKIVIKSFGVRRPRRKTARVAPVVEVKEEKPVKPVKEKAPVRPKAGAEVPEVEAPVVDVPQEPEVKPAKKKSAPKAKASAKKEENPE